MAFSHADGVEKVLADEKRAMDCYELASLALERRYIESRAQSPGNSICISPSLATSSSVIGDGGGGDGRRWP